MERHAIRLTIRGQVQGVGYRAWAVEVARRAGLDGWVRNRWDGSVELLAIGEEAALEPLETACRRGPAAALVTSVDRVEADDDDSVGFNSRPTT